MLPRVVPFIALIYGAAVAVADPEDGKPDLAGQAPETAQTPPKPEEDPGGDEPAFQSALRQLSHEDFKQRRAAQDQLLAWGKEDIKEGIETLYAVYRTTDDPEVRLRSREVLKRLVIIEQPFDGPGYLGIRMENAQARNAEGEIQPAVRVTEVREGTAAEVATLKNEDLITGVDKEVFNDLMPITIFSEYIKSKRPGDEIVLQVRRGEESLTLKATLRRRSPLLDRITQWGTELELPKQSDLDEADFQAWLQTRAKAEREAAKRKKRPALAPGN